MPTLVWADEFNNGAFDYQLKIVGPDMLNTYSIAVATAWAGNGEQEGTAHAFLASEKRMLEIYESMATMLGEVDAIERLVNHG